MANKSLRSKHGTLKATSGSAIPSPGIRSRVRGSFLSEARKERTKSRHGNRRSDVLPSFEPSSGVSRGTKTSSENGGDDSVHIQCNRSHLKASRESPRY